MKALDRKKIYEKVLAIKFLKLRLKLKAAGFECNKKQHNEVVMVF